MGQVQKKAGIGSHQSKSMINDEWLTPVRILKPLGPFDLDPCAPVVRPWDTAKKHYTINDNGLLMPWEGLVWLNPPYGKYLGDWLARMAMHNNGIALIFARTDTAAFFTYVWPFAKAVLFVKGRIHFHYVTGERSVINSGGPSVLVAYGQLAYEKLKNCKIPGKFISL